MAEGFFSAIRRVVTEKVTDLISNFQSTKPVELTEIQKQIIEQLKTSNLNQKDRLILEVQFEIIECVICSELITSNHSIWTCSSCKNIFHFKCIKKWAKSSFDGYSESIGWRCVACQHTYRYVPINNYCFCGSVKDPKPKSGQLPHSCGKKCSKFLPCKHICKSFCHPGQCDLCDVQVSSFCYCGKEYKTTVCYKSKFSCNNFCDKWLKCGICKCTNICHPPPCKPCQEWMCYLKVEIFESNKFLIIFLIIIVFLTYLDYCSWT